MSQPLRILHLEDDPLDANLIRATLAATGVAADITTVQGRADFTAALDAGSVDLILADYSLPTFDGLEALALAQERQPKVPFLFVTGALGEQLVVQTLKQGATDYVLKDHLHRLAPAVQRAVREAAERGRREQSEILLRETMHYAPCLLWAGEVVGLPGWEQDRPDEHPFRWEATFLDEAAARNFLPLDVPPGSTYTECSVASRLPEDARAIDKNAAVAFRTGAAHYTQDFRCRDRTGRVLWLHEEVTIQPGAPGRWKVFGVRTDITERKEIEEALRHEHAFITGVLDSTGALVIVLDRAGRIRRFNRACEQVTGYTETEVVGRNFLEFLIPDEDLPGVRQAWEALRAGHFPNEHENQWLAKDGSRHLLTWYNTAIVRPTGELDYIIGTGVDITKRKRAEEALAQIAREWQTTFDAANDAIWLLDKDQRVVRANKMADQLFHQPCGKAVGRHCYEIVHGTTAPIPECPVERARHTLQRESMELQIGGRWVQVTSDPIVDAAGQYAGAVHIVSDITERKHAEEALRTSERRFRAVLERGSELVTLVDVTGKILAESPNMTAVLGYATGQLLGQDVLSLTHPDDRAAGEAAFAELVTAPGQTRRVEARSRTADGGWRWLDTVGTNLLHDPAVGAIVLNSRDITERKRAQDSLEVSAEQYRTLAENSPEIIDRFDRDLRHLYVNVAGLRVLNRPAEEVIGKTIAETGVAEPYRSRWEERLRRVFATGQPLDVEDAFSTPDGLRVFASRCVPESDGSGVVCSVLVVSNDITARKQAEEVLRRSQADLEELVLERTLDLSESEERFRQLAISIREVFWLEQLDPYRILYVSPAFEKVWGRSCQSIYRSPNGWLSAVHPADRVRVRQITSRRRPYEIEYRIRRPDGSLRWVRDRGFPIRNLVGKVYRMAGLAEDITQQKQLEAEILNTSQREQERIGHDLHDGVCQLLVGAGLTCGVLRRRLAPKVPAAAAEFDHLQQVLKEALAQTRSVTQSVMPVALESGGLLVALEELANSATKLFKVPCTFRCPHRFTVADTTVALQLYRIAQEAVHNAMRHAKPRHVTITLTAVRGRVSLRIADDGRGLAPRGGKPTGMGLKIMEYRARRIGGELTVGPGAKRGTVVTCTCPNRKPKR